MSKRLAAEEPKELKSSPLPSQESPPPSHDEAAIVVDVGPDEQSKEGGDLVSDLESDISHLESMGDDASDTPSCEDHDVSNDPHYYFEDGNVIVRIENVLFKIHASLFKAKSKILEEMFTMRIKEDNEGVVTKEPTGDGLPTEVRSSQSEAPREKALEEEAPKPEDEAEPKSNQEIGQDTAFCGTSDAHPVVISDVSPSQFRHFLKMFYSLAHESPLAGLGETSTNPEELWARFELLLDVARLSHRFCIPDMEKWATRKLESLMKAKTEELANHFGYSTVEYEYVVEALQYAKDTSNSRLLHDTRFMIQLSFPVPQNETVLEKILYLFRFEGLRDLDSAIYGYMFLLLLNQGHQTWEVDDYSHEDRMALFSAQCRLTPLPSALLEGQKSPLYFEVDSAVAFSNATSSKSTPPCSSKCRNATFQAWKEEFDDPYYDSLTGQQFLPSIAALRLLPQRRLKFGRKIRGQPCSRSCYNVVLSWIDGDIEQVYSRLADYYKAIR